uniref:Immunoglobulin V-set domain-containing protein n=1 Tax=Sciurus vulgaris TaxID=55149 RepID=A0A8D2JK37_SCIVU
MSTRLLCCVALCLLKAGLKDAVVTQFPRHKISRTEREVTLQCSQNMNHLAMYWYRQDSGLGLQLVYYSPNTDIIEKGDAPEGYRVSRREKGRFPLTLESASANQTSVYLCASSESTAPHSHFLSAQKGANQGGVALPSTSLLPTWRGFPGTAPSPTLHLMFPAPLSLFLSFRDNFPIEISLCPSSISH